MKVCSGCFVAVLVAAAVVAVSFHPAAAAGGEKASAPAASSAEKERKIKLTFTDEQKAKLRAVIQKYRPKMAPLTGEFVKERRALEEMAHADKVDDAAIRAQVMKVAPIEADVAVQRAHAFAELRAVLTAEQLQQAKDAGRAQLDMLLMQHAERLDMEASKKKQEGPKVTAPMSTPAK